MGNERKNGKRQKNVRRGKNGPVPRRTLHVEGARQGSHQKKRQKVRRIKTRIRVRIPAVIVAGAVVRRTTQRRTRRTKRRLRRTMLKRTRRMKAVHRPRPRAKKMISPHFGRE